MTLKPKHNDTGSKKKKIKRIGIGDVVMLKSGGPKMTVVKVESKDGAAPPPPAGEVVKTETIEMPDTGTTQQPPENFMVGTVWFNADQELNNGNFNMKSLRLASKD